MNLEILKKLLAIQETDTRLLQIKRKFKAADDAIKAASGLPQLRKELEDLRGAVLAQTVKIARNNSDRTERKQKIEELQERLYGGLITNMTEMRAVEAEQASTKREIEQIDEQRTPLEMELEDLKVRQGERQQELEQIENSWKERKGALVAERAQCASEYKELGEKRRAAFKELPDEVVALYRDIFQKTRGTAVVRVERGVCMGCHLTLPLEPRDGDFGRNLPRCSNCTRILVFD